MEDQHARALVALRAFVVGSEPFATTMQRVCDHAATAFGADAAGLTLLSPDGKETAAVGPDADGAAGFASSRSLPLVLPAGTGVLTLYSGAPDRLTGPDDERGVVFAAEASVVLTNAQAYWDQASRAENLAAAMASRAVIEQAKGVIIATTGRTADEAFELLRVQSQSENRKVHEIAQELIDRHQRKGGPAPG